MATAIEWVQNPDGTPGEVWNPIRGCSPVSAGCKNCWAARLASTRLKRFPQYEGLADDGKWTGKISHDMDWVNQEPYHWRKPRAIFVCSMGDLFHKDVYPLFQICLFQAVHIMRKHTFIVLTKRPEMALDFFTRTREGGLCWDWPIPNLWLGVSVEDQATADERIPTLLKCEPFANLLFISAEPLLGRLDVESYLDEQGYESGGPEGWVTTGRGVDWVIAGGESGPKARPMHPGWARSLRDQAVAAGVPFFFKQWGEWRIGESRDFGRLPTKVVYWEPDPDAPSQLMARVGKKRAGRLLDGKEHNEFPKTKEIQRA